MKLDYSLDYVSLIMNTYLKPGMACIDATCGNGNDALAISKLIGTEGKLYCFDIQEKAIFETQTLLKKHGYKAHYVLDNHEKIHEHIKEAVDFCIFNLGYLPGGDKSITTDGQETWKSIESVIELLRPGGIIIVVVYIGHESGRLEGEYLESNIKSLDQNEVNVSKIQFKNQKNTPPYVLVFNKKELKKKKI